MRTIYLLRHGRTEGPSEEPCCLGVTDVSLSEAGREEIRAAAEKLKGAGIEAIYTSPLKRCMESAEILAELLSGGGAALPVKAVPDLREISMGQWDGLPFREIREKYPEEYEARGRNIARFRVPGGETFEETAIRARAAYDAICRENSGNILLVGHAGVFRTIIAGLEGKRLKDLMDISQGYGEIYEIKLPVFDALITAAGFSSRMGDFKPLMEISGKKNILRQIETFRLAGIRRILVVTGFRGEEIREAVKEAGFSEWVAFAENPDYGTTEMFDSLRIGFRALLPEDGPEEKRPDGIFTVPVDVPLFTEFSVRRLMEEWKIKPGAVLVPSWEMDAPEPVPAPPDPHAPEAYPPEEEEGPVTGHPVLIPAAAFEKVLTHDGTDGLSGVFSRCAVEHVPMADPGGMMDADTKEAFQILVFMDICRGVPGRADCLRLLKYLKVPEDRTAHMETVAGIALDLGRRALRAGAMLDLKLLYTAALLHDIAKGQDFHAEAGARILEQLSMPEAADLVRCHMDLPEEYLKDVNEHMLLYLADKMCRGNRQVTVEERFEMKKEKLSGDKEALAAWKRRYDAALRARELLSLLEKEGRALE